MPESTGPVRGWAGRRRLGRWRTAEKRTVERGLHRRLRQELRSLGIAPPLDVEKLARALGERRGRPMVLRPFALEKPGPSGLWVEMPKTDVVLYQEETTRLHQRQIILHELLHMIVDEWEESCEVAERSPGEFVEEWSVLMPVLDPKLIRRVAARCSYEDAEECSVELAATIILEWSSVVDALPPLSEDPRVRRVQSALGDRRGWL
ncbi:hypothetical protein ACFWIJ_08170 [Streptomyces sp. NPDC127079]|uniref:hypothetical protein n=1 Tax=Streptomyces sp. NPDC127079 TaxID=3347132 RepID=UPI00364EC407